jgi:hypothetical protein
MPNTALAVHSVSSHRPRQSAATMPSGTPKSTARPKAASASSAVAGSWRASSETTGWRL